MCSLHIPAQFPLSETRVLNSVGFPKTSHPGHPSSLWKSLISYLFLFCSGMMSSSDNVC